MLPENRVTDFFARAHGLANSGNVGVVPGVVVDKSWSVSHTTDLVPIIPPRHDFSILVCVLAKPIVGLTVIVNQELASIGQTASQHDRRRRVGVRCNPGAVSNENQKIDQHGGCHDGFRGIREDSNSG